MKTESVELTNVGPFAQIKFNLSGLGPGLVAIVGGNGAGKTTLMESMLPTPLMREWPSDPKTNSGNSIRGVGFIEHCTGKRSALDTTIILDDTKYRILLTAEKKKKKQEAYIYKDGVNLNESGRLPEFDAIVESIFPTHEVILSAPYAAQGGQGSFIKLDKNKRRDLFARLLGIEEYEIKQEQAKEALNLIDLNTETLNNDFNEISFKINEISKNKNEIDELTEQIREYEVFLEYNRNQKLSFENELNVIRENQASFLSLSKQRESLTSKIADLTAISGIDIELERVRLDRLLYDRSIVDQRLKETQTCIDTLLSDLKPIDQEILDTKERNRYDLICFHKTFSTIDSEIKRRSDSKARLDTVNFALLPCQKCALTQGAKYVPLEIAIFNYKMAEIGSIEQNRVDNTLYKLDLLNMRSEALSQSLHLAYQELNSLGSEHGRLSSLILDLEKVISNAVQLSELDTLKESLRYLDDTISGLDIDDSELIKKLDLVTTSLQATELGLRKFGAEVARLGGEVTGMLGGSSEAELHESFEEIVRTQAINVGEAERLRLLVDLLDELRTITIANAFPEVEEIANDLLTTYLEGRFRIRLETSVPKANKGFKEDLALIIIDTQTGREGTHVSGGETVIIDEAIRLAIAIFNSNSSGFRFETLFRDETTGSLTQENASSYIKMLRHALVLGNFYQIVFISHYQHVINQADHRINLE